MTRTEEEIKEQFGKSIWDMTPQEMVDNNLVHDWVNIVDGNSGWTDEDEEAYWMAHKLMREDD